jgi:hypothetical protein
MLRVTGRLSNLPVERVEGTIEEFAAGTAASIRRVLDEARAASRRDTVPLSTIRRC